MKSHIYNYIVRAMQDGHRLSLLALLVLCGLTSQAQTQDNVLSIPEFEGRIDKTVNVPIYLNNTTEIVAAQFDVILPFALEKDGTATLTNRANGHQVAMKAQDGTRLKVVILSQQNNNLRGNAGLLLRIPMSPYDDGNTNKPYPVQLSNIVLTDRQGNDVAKEKSATGYFKVSRANLPDLIVPSVIPLTPQANPGEMISVSYEVKNDGNGSTQAGWTEKIYIESALTGVRTFLGGQAYVDTLGAGMTVSRQYQTFLPTLVHADGEQHVIVEVLPGTNTGELLVDQGNNTGRSAATVNIGKRLFVKANKLNVNEGYYYRGWYGWRTEDYLTLTVSRSGDWSTEELFPLTCSVNGLLRIDGGTLQTKTPQWIRIPANASSTTVRVYAVDDEIVRAREADLFIDVANGYNGDTLHITRTDNDVNPLTITTSLSKMTEGGQSKLLITATRGGELTDDVELTLTCSQALRFENKPLSIFIPKKESQGTLELILTDDDVPQPDVTATFTARATDYQTAYASVQLLDDDRPQLSMTLSPSTVSENAGAQATTAIIRRDRGSEKETEMTIYLTSANPQQAFFADKLVVFRKGEVEKEVAVGVTDNENVDGQRQYQLNAALYLPTINSTASSTDRAYAKALLTVTDDESPYLTVTSRTTAIGEGSSFTATVRRYVASTSNAQVVNLTADKASDVTIPATVTIPAGSYTATFTVNVNRNEQEGDERMLYINATANGLNMGSLAMRITDRTLPDATIAAAGYQNEALYSGMGFTLNPQISNVGTASLPKGTQVEFFLAPTDRLYSYTRTTPLFSTETTAPIGIGETKTFTFSGTMPAVVGTYWLYARVNGNGEVSEFSTANNVSSNPQKVTIAAPFSVADLKVEQESYLPGQTVKVTGRVTTRLENGLHGQQVSITLSGNGQSATATNCTVDEMTGEFEAYPLISASASGLLTVKARAIGQTEADLTREINVWNMRLTADYTTWTLDEAYPKTGQFTLRNTSGKTITGLKIDHESLPFGCEMDALQLATTTLEPGQQTTLNYRVNPTKSMTSGQYATLNIVAECAEGVKVTLPIRYYCRATNCFLVFEQSTQYETLLLNGTRNVRVKVTNRGLKTSGAIEVIPPTGLDWITCTTTNLTEILPDRSAWLTFELKHQPGMHSGQSFSAYLSLNPENGSSAGMKMVTTIVGTEWSTLKVNCTDIFTKARREYRHVSAAQVSITEARTGKQVMTGLTDGNGYWQTEKLTQGDYYVTVSALRHKSVRKLLTLGPGDEQQMSFFLPYQAVLTDFVAWQDVIDGSYHLSSTIDIDRTAPQAIVIPTLPENGFECGTDSMQLTLRNEGSFEASNVQLLFPAMSGVRFTVGQIDNIAPGGEITVPVVYEGPEQGRRRSIAKILMSYQFKIGGETLGEDDYYQSLVGCASSLREDPPMVDDDEPRRDDDTEGQTDEEDFYGGGSQNEAKSGGGSSKSALPTTNSSMELAFDDLSHVYVGQSFYATLRIKNGQQAEMGNIRFSHMVSDDSDDYETDFATRFDCVQEELQGFQATGSQLSLAGQGEASIRLKLTPSEEAATDSSHVYYIGGQLQYVDRARNILCTAVLSQVKMTVRLKGKAGITYLLQGDYLGNDTIEGIAVRAIPAQMVALVSNEGRTRISSLRISSDEPAVKTNLTSEPVTIRNRYAAFDGVQTNAHLSNMMIDTLRQGQTLVGQWIVEAAQDSRLTDIDSLKNSVEILSGNEVELTVNGVHRLYRGVSRRPLVPLADDEATSEDEMTDALAKTDVFLLDDLDDPDHLPDGVMTSDGMEDSLQIVSTSAVITGQSGHYTLTIQAEKAGWVYARLSDPTYGLMTLKRVDRGEDVLSPANAWLTDHSVTADYSSIAENRFHLADSVPAGQTTYTLTFEPIPGDTVRAMKLRLYTASGKEVMQGGETKEAVSRVTLDLTGKVRKLATNNITFISGDESQDYTKIKVLEEGANSFYTIDLTAFEKRPGHHQLIVNVANLKEPLPSRRNATGMIAIEWTEQLTVQAHLNIEVQSGDETGTVDKPSGDYDYGELRIVATPKDGYEFDHWEEEGRFIESGDTLVYNVAGASTLQAFFMPRLYEINFLCDETKGTVSGISRCFRLWQQTVSSTAIPNDGYVFSHWTNGTDSVTTQTINVVVTGDCTYTAVFIDKKTAGIVETGFTSCGTSIYGMDGRLLRRNVGNVREVLRSLPEGLYIVGGRKVLNVKNGNR